MAALLAKFRINYSDVTVISDVTKRAKDETRGEFQDLIKRFVGQIPEAELVSHKEKTNRHLRIAESLREHSRESELVIM